jgi:hypothetical protein
MCFVSGSNPEVTSSTIANNTTTDTTYAALQCEDSDADIEQTIISHNFGGGGAMRTAGTETPNVMHCFSYDNEGGDDFFGNVHDCLIADPYMCDVVGGTYELHTNSPCMPDYNPWGLLIGRYGEGDCGYAGVGEEAIPVTKLSLLPPAPNPFSSVSTIGYEAPCGDATLKVAVYDLRGRHVATLHNGPVSAMRGSLVWHGCDESGHRVASGVYFVKATRDGEEVSRKLAVLR